MNRYASIDETIRAILDDADEAKERYDKDKSDLEYGQLLAYSTVLSNIKTYFVDDEEVLKLLPKDIDARYLMG